MFNVPERPEAGRESIEFTQASPNKRLSREGESSVAFDVSHTYMVEGRFGTLQRFTNRFEVEFVLRSN